MNYKTQHIARHRVYLKRNIRYKGVSVKNDLPTKDLIKLFKALYPKKSPLSPRDFVNCRPVGIDIKCQE